MPLTVRLPFVVTLPVIALLAWNITMTASDARAQQQLKLAETQQHQFEFDAAHELRRQAAQLSPNNAQIQLALAKSARNLWFFRDAKEWQQEADAAFQRASQLSPHWTVPHYEHARMYSFKEQHERALDLLAPALRLDPNHAGYWLERARYLEALGRRGEARQAYERCRKLNPIHECVTGSDRLKDQS